MHSSDIYPEATDRLPPQTITRGRKYINWALAVVLILFLLLLAFAGYRYHRRMSFINRVSSRTDKSAPIWLRQTIGKHRAQAFEKIEIVGISRKMSDDDVEFIAYLGVPHIVVEGRPFTRDFGRSIARNRQIESLKIERWSDLPTQEFLEEISQSRSLESISLHVSELDGKVLQPLLSMKSLKEVNLAFEIQNSFSLDVLKKLPRSTRLRLTPTGPIRKNDLKQIAALDRPGLQLILRCDDEELQILSSMTHLESLSVDSSGVTDEGLEALENMHGLKWLELSYPHMTDAGLPALYGLSNLKTLRLMRTDVTEEGIRELKSHLPDLQVYYDPLSGADLTADESAP
jgi:hypothetical protein